MKHLKEQKKLEQAKMTDSTTDGQLMLIVHKPAEEADEDAES